MSTDLLIASVLPKVTKERCDDILWLWTMFRKQLANPDFRRQSFMSYTRRNVTRRIGCYIGNRFRRGSWTRQNMSMYFVLRQNMLDGIMNWD